VVGARVVTVPEVYCRASDRRLAVGTQHGPGEQDALPFGGCIDHLRGVLGVRSIEGSKGITVGHQADAGGMRSAGRGDGHYGAWRYAALIVLPWCPVHGEAKPPGAGAAYFLHARHAKS